MKSLNGKCRIWLRLMFLLIAVLFGLVVFSAIRDGRVRVSRCYRDFASVHEKPVRFWIYAAVAALGSGLGFYGTFAEKR